MTDQTSEQKIKNDQHNANDNELKQCQKNTSERLPQKETSVLTNWLTFKNIFGTIFVIGATGYLVRFFILHQTKQVLKSKLSWCNWKAHVPFHELVNESSDTLSKDLIIAIQSRHVNTKNPADHVYPMTHFLHALDQETVILNRYLQLTSFEQQFGINRFLKHHNLTELVISRLDKLAYLKSLFFEWAKQQRTRKARAS